MNQQKNWKLIAWFAIFISGPALAEDAAMGTIKFCPRHLKLVIQQEVPPLSS